MSTDGRKQQTHSIMRPQSAWMFRLLFFIKI